MGPGVYLTERPLCVILFSVCKNGENEAYKKWKENTRCGNKIEFKFKKENFIFVNEILESEKLKNKTVSKQNSSPKTDLEGKLRKHEFEKYTIEKKNCRTDSIETYENDSYCRKIKVCIGTKEDEQDYYVCHERLVIPRYLIQCSLKIIHNGENIKILVYVLLLLRFHFFINCIVHYCENKLLLSELYYVFML